MKHLDFIVWICVFPLADAITEAIQWRYSDRKKDTDFVRGFTALIKITIWVGVGILLW